MLPDAFQTKQKTRNGGLSLVGLGASLAITAFPDDASADVQGSTESQNIAASGPSELGQQLTIPIDIDGDGNTEFNLVGWLGSNTSEVYVRLVPVEAGATIVASGGYADKLAGDAVIDAGSNYIAGADLAWSETKGDQGNWVPAVQRGYAGVAFDFQGNTHYGSLDIEVTKFTAIYNSASSEFDATLHGFAWETTPDTAILAGAAPALPAPVGIPAGSFMVSLALAAALCLLGWRRLRRPLN